MKTLSYPPLYASVFVLQVVVLLCMAYGRLPEAWRIAFVAGWALLLGAALTIGYARRRSPVSPKQWAELLVPLTTLGVGLWLWVLLVGPRFFFMIAALSLLVGRNALLATRRALYLDLAIAGAAFFDAIGAQRTTALAGLGVAFLAALVFVLMADYSDRRLAYVHADDAAARAGLAPSLRNAALATVLVLLVGALIYTLLPQPRRGGFGLPDPDSPYLLDYIRVPEGRWPLGRQDAGGGPRPPGEPGEPGPSSPSPPPGSGQPEAPQSAQGRLDVSRAGSDVGGGGSRSAAPPGDAPGAQESRGGRPAATPVPPGGQQQPVPPPPPLILAYVDAPHELYARTHAFVLPAEREWLESPLEPAIVQGARRFTIASPDATPTVMQHYRINGTLEPRIPAAYRPERLAFPARAIAFSGELVLYAGGELKRGTRYSVDSALGYIDARPTGGVERTPSEGYLWLPPEMPARVRELAAQIVRGKRPVWDRAEALEAYLRTQYRYGSFDAGDTNPTHAFLFDGRRGGSAQFASALALMLRSSGIPANVVAGYRARRLNPLHGNFEIWQADRHHWVEAYVERRWTLYEPSPWASLPASKAPASMWAAAKNYVRLAKRSDSGAEVFPPERPSDAYLRLVLAWGWTATFGPWILLGLVLAALVAWQQQRWLRPLLDGIDLLRLRRPASPQQRVLSAYGVIERTFMRRGFARERTENHAEYLRRLAAARPHLASPLTYIQGSFAAARYGSEEIQPGLADQTVRACREVVGLIDERPATG